MGNNESYEAPVTHPRFSKVQYSTNTLAMLVKEPLISSQKAIEAWTEKSKLYSHIYNSNDIIRTAEYKIQLSGVCADSGTLLVRFEDKYLTNLKSQIAARQLNGKLYTEQQIWHLLLIICRCASLIYPYGDKHIIGNIHPYNILINRKQEYKLLATNFSYSLPGQLDHFQEYRLHGDSRAFISPELLGFLTSNKYSDYPEYPRCVDKQAGEAFCLGMTILSMATLQTHMMKCFKAQNNLSRRKLTVSNRISSQSVPQWESHSQTHQITNISALSNAIQTVESIPMAVQDNRPSYSDIINHDYLNGLLQIVRQRYSTTFYEMLVSLIHFDPEKRIKADRLYREYLTPVEKYIEAYDRKWIELIEPQQPEHEQRQESRQSELKQADQEYLASGPKR